MAGKESAARKTASPARRGLRAVVGRAAATEPLALDALIHHRLRLGMVSALAANDSLSFTELRDLLRTTDGNLSVHARKLEDAGYVRIERPANGRRRRVNVRLTDAGRTAFRGHVAALQAIVGVAQSRHGEARSR